MREEKVIQGYGRQVFPNIFKAGRIGKFKVNNRCKYAACDEARVDYISAVMAWHESFEGSRLGNNTLGL